MMTLEQIGQLAVLWCDADDDYTRRRAHFKAIIRAHDKADRARKTLKSAIHTYKLLEEAKGKGANDGTV